MLLFNWVSFEGEKELGIHEESLFLLVVVWLAACKQGCYLKPSVQLAQAYFVLFLYHKKIALIM